MTLRAGFAGAAMRHHGPHPRAAPTSIQAGTREWALLTEQGNVSRAALANLCVALSRKTICRLTPAAFRAETRPGLALRAAGVALPPTVQAIQAN